MKAKRNFALLLIAAFVLAGFGLTLTGHSPGVVVKSAEDATRTTSPPLDHAAIMQGLTIAFITETMEIVVIHNGKETHRALFAGSVKLNTPTLLAADYNHVYYLSDDAAFGDRELTRLISVEAKTGDISETACPSCRTLFHDPTTDTLYAQSPLGLLTVPDQTIVLPEPNGEVVAVVGGRAYTMTRVSRDFTAHEINVMDVRQGEHVAFQGLAANTVRVLGQHMTPDGSPAVLFSAVNRDATLGECPNQYGLFSLTIQGQLVAYDRDPESQGTHVVDPDRGGGVIHGAFRAADQSLYVSRSIWDCEGGGNGDVGSISMVEEASRFIVEEDNLRGQVGTAWLQGFETADVAVGLDAASCASQTETLGAGVLSSCGALDLVAQSREGSLVIATGVLHLTGATADKNELSAWVEKTEELGGDPLPVAEVLESVELPAGVCYNSISKRGWESTDRILLAESRGESRDQQGLFSGASVLGYEVLGEVDLNNDGVNEMIVELSCTGHELQSCCTGRTGIASAVVALSGVSTGSPVLLGEPMLGGASPFIEGHEPSHRMIQEAVWKENVLTLTEYYPYPELEDPSMVDGDPFESLSVSYEWDDGAWVAIDER